MNSVLIAILVVIGVLAAVALCVAAVLVWCSHTLLSGVATVDVDEVDPALRKEIDRLQLDYEVAEELGYGGDVLLGIESQLNAAKLAAAAAAGDPGATLTVFVLPPQVEPESDLGKVYTFPLSALPTSALPVWSRSVTAPVFPAVQLQ